MFDLETAITSWRRSAESTWRADAAALAELEDHLREEVAALIRSGHGGDEAWRMASAKLGEPASLAREFSKLNRLAPADRLVVGMLLGIAALSVGCLTILVVARSAEVLAKPLLATHVIVITLGYGTGLLAAAAAGYGTMRTLVARRPVPALQGVVLRVVRLTTLVSVSLTVFGFVLGAIWAHGEWGRAFTASSEEIGALLVIISFAVAATMAWQSAMPARISLAIATGSGGIILAAWLGVSANRYGYPGLSTLIGFGGLGACLALAALSLLARDKLVGV
jgi:hypothetical protein